MAILLAMTIAAMRSEMGSSRHAATRRADPLQAGTASATIAEIERAFAALELKIGAIEALEWGTDCSPEGKAQGFTHCFFLTFAALPSATPICLTPITRPSRRCCAPMSTRCWWSTTRPGT